jgi:acyl-CoA thioesterase FadM
MTAKAYTHEVAVTAELIDGGGVLYHANFFVLAERAREAAPNELGSPTARMWREGRALMVRTLSAEYWAPVFAGARSGAAGPFGCTPLHASSAD